MRSLVLAALLGLVSSCSRQDELTEHSARATAEALIASNGPVLRDFDRMTWKELRQVSPTEAHGTAALIYSYRLPNGGTGQEIIEGQFVYHKLPGKGWTLVGVEFPNPNNLYHSINEEVHVKVSSASVDISDRDRVALGRARDASQTERDGPQEGGDSISDVRAMIPTTVARRTAERYLASASDDAEDWRIESIGQVAPIEDNRVELPAVLVVEDSLGSRRYRGAFQYELDRDSGRWTLVHMAFHGDGQSPIVRDIALAVD
jgi:hypothetical protein